MFDENASVRRHDVSIRDEPDHAYLYVLGCRFVVKDRFLPCREERGTAVNVHLGLRLQRRIRRGCIRRCEKLSPVATWVASLEHVVCVARKSGDFLQSTSDNDEGAPTTQLHAPSNVIASSTPPKLHGFDEHNRSAAQVPGAFSVGLTDKQKAAVAQRRCASLLVCHGTISK